MTTSKRILIICLCALFVGAVITTTILTRNREDNNEQDLVPFENLTLIDFGSHGCVPCDNLQPVLKALREKYDNIDVLFYDIRNTTEGAQMANRYKISATPTLIFFDTSGKELKRILGFHSQETIEDIFRELGWIE